MILFKSWSADRSNLLGDRAIPGEQDVETEIVAARGGTADEARNSLPLVSVSPEVHPRTETNMAPFLSVAVR